MSPPPVPHGGHRAARNDYFARVLAIPVVVLGVLAAVAALAPGRVGSAAATSSVAVVVAAPLLRVLWLAIRWARRGDRRYASVAAGVLAVIAVGTVVALSS